MENTSKNGKNRKDGGRVLIDRCSPPHLHRQIDKNLIFVKTIYDSGKELDGEMVRTKILILGNVLTILMLGSSLAVGAEASMVPVLDSRWVYVPPIINGQFPATESWGNPQLELMPPDYAIHTFVYFMNDHDRIYILVDAANLAWGDYSEDLEDHCTIVLYNPLDNVTIKLTIFGDERGLVLLGAGSTLADGIEMKAGFGPTPNSPRSHRFYEFSILCAIVTVTRTGAQWYRFASPPSLLDSLPYDAATRRVNTWPPNVIPDDFDTYGIVRLATPAVGGVVTPTKGLAPVFQYSGLALMVAAAGLTLARKRRGESNYEAIDHAKATATSRAESAEP